MPTSYAHPTMRGVHGEIPDRLLEERRAMGHDHGDELWDGVLHMSPQPTTPHNQLVVDLVLALAASAKGRGLRIFHDAQAMYDPDDRGDPYELPIPGVKNWRVPDCPSSVTTR